MKIPFIQAKHYRALSTVRNPRVVVVHSMESQEKGVTAENCAHYFATSGRVASAHYCIDNNSVVQCVQCKDIAYGAKGMNRIGIHLEHAGTARQTRFQWLDEYSDRMLDVSAMLCGKVLCPKFKIAIRKLSDDDIRRSIDDPSISGFCGHVDVVRALKQGNHWDPGLSFPWDVYLDKVAHFRQHPNFGILPKK